MLTQTPYVLQTDFTTSLRNLFVIQPAITGNYPVTEKVWLIQTPFLSCSLTLLYFPESYTLNDGGLIHKKFLEPLSLKDSNNLFQQFIPLAIKSGLIKKGEDGWEESIEFVKNKLGIIELRMSNLYFDSSIKGSSIPYDIFTFYEIIVAFSSFISFKELT